MWKSIKNRYLLCNLIECYIDRDNRRYFDELWYKYLGRI